MADTSKVEAVTTPAAPAAVHAPPAGAHVVPLWQYFLVYLALLGLTVTTVAAAYTDLGRMNNIVAVGIAGAKAVLVILVFMHVRWSPRLIPLAAFAGFFWLVLLIGGSLGDYWTRGALDWPP
jgi:cytochrome c oxidase subunit IV